MKQSTPALAARSRARMRRVSVRSVQRWLYQPEDARALSMRPSPPNKFSGIERQALLDAACSVEFASLTAHQIVPKLADEGIYLGSESTFYRVLKAENLSRRRGRASVARRRVPTTHRADAPNQLWCWDITWMPTTIRGRYFYWYMMKDVYSRKLVANEVWEVESGEHASALLTKGCLIEGTAGRPLVLHSDSNNVSTSFSTARPVTAVVGLPEGLVPRSVPDGLTLTLIDLICCLSPDPSAGREHRTARFHLAAACDPRRA
jgi:putative transposase